MPVVAPGPIPEVGPRAQPTDEETVTRAFSLSMLISATRCVLSYVILPWALPVLGVAGGVGPILGLAVGTVALLANAWSIRRFWRARHRWRWAISSVNVGVMVLVGILMAQDITELQ